MAERIHFAESDGWVTIVISARRHGLTIGFLGAWLAGWALAWWCVLGLVQSGAWSTWPVQSKVMLLMWIAGWGLGGWVARKWCLWMMFGREVITTDGLDLTIECLVPLSSQRSSFVVAELKNLRHVVPLSDDERTVSALAMDMEGSLAFDLHGKTVRFARGLDDREAQLVLDYLRTRLSVS